MQQHYFYRTPSKRCFKYISAMFKLNLLPIAYIDNQALCRLFRSLQTYPLRGKTPLTL